MSDRNITISTLLKASVVQEKMCKSLNEKMRKLE